MRLSAAFSEEAHRYRVYDYPAGEQRRDLCWVDDVTNQVGVGFATWGREYVFEVEQRKRVLIIPGVYWIALDLPEEEDFVPPYEVNLENGKDVVFNWSRPKDPAVVK